MKYTKEYLINNKVAISCPTVEDWKAVVGELLKETTWMGGDIKVNESTWEVYKDKSCVNLYYNGKISYESTNYYQSESYTIITAKEFLEDRGGKWDIGMLTCDETLIEDAFGLGDSLQEMVNAIGTRYIEDKPKKTIMKTLTNTLKKVLPGDIQTQYKAGFRNGDIELTQEGVNELINILADKYKAELTARAEEIIKEEEKKN